MENGATICLSTLHYSLAPYLQVRVFVLLLQGERKEKKKKKKPLFRSESLHHRQALLNCWQEEEERKNDINAMQRLSQQRYTKKKKKRKNHSAPINCRSGGIRCWCRATRLEPSTCTHMHTHSLSPLFPLPLTLCWSCEKLLWVTGSSGGDKIN